MTETHTADTITLGFQDGDYDLKSEPVFCGIPVPGTDVLIVDHDAAGSRRRARADHRAHPSILSAYYRNEAATADASVTAGCRPVTSESSVSVAVCTIWRGTRK